MNKNKPYSKRAFISDDLHRVDAVSGYISQNRNGRVYPKEAYLTISDGTNTANVELFLVDKTDKKRVLARLDRLVAFIEEYRDALRAFLEEEDGK